MQTEDYIYQEDLVASKYPLSKTHVIAISITVILACTLYAFMPKHQPYRASDLDEIFSVASDDSLSYEDTMDSTLSLSDVLLGTKTYQQPATSQDAYLAHTDQEVYTETAQEALENYEEDEELEATLSATSNESFDEALAKTEQTANSSLASLKWITEEINKGDTLSSMFSDLNIPYSVMQAIADNEETGGSLTNLRPGNKLYFAFDDSNNLIGFVKQINGDEQWRFSRSDVSSLDFEVVREAKDSHIFVMTAEGLKPVSELGEKPAYKKRGRLVVATIGQGESFSTAAHKAGLTYAEISTITQMFDGRVRFARDIQPGDTLRVLFSEDKGEGKMNAVELKLKKGGILSTYRNITDDMFYDEKGYNISTNTFRRFPLNGKVIISSHFNPNRRHPVTKKVRPHNGTDFAVKVGTPIVAPADGIVEIAKYSRTAGYYIVLRHRNSYSTVYMHCSKLLVKPGQRVKIGDMIARSGNTGMSTGPHLHYELRRNGRPVNAMKVSLPANEDVAIAKSNLQRFENNVALFKKELYEESLIAQH